LVADQICVATGAVGSAGLADSVVGHVPLRAGGSAFRSRSEQAVARQALAAGVGVLADFAAFDAAVAGVFRRVWEKCGRAN